MRLQREKRPVKVCSSRLSSSAAKGLKVPNVWLTISKQPGVWKKINTDSHAVILFFLDFVWCACESDMWLSVSRCISPTPWELWLYHLISLWLLRGSYAFPVVLTSWVSGGIEMAWITWIAGYHYALKTPDYHKLTQTTNWLLYFSKPFVDVEGSLGRN